MLRLPGAPADDAVTLTLDIWLAALEGQTVIWSEHLDAGASDRHSVRSIAPATAGRRRSTSWTTWATVIHLQRCPRPGLSEAQRQKNIARLREITAMLGKNKSMNSVNKE